MINIETKNEMSSFIAELETLIAKYKVIAPIKVISTVPVKPLGTLILSAGHSGVNTKGEYLTNGKSFFHKGQNFHNGGWFYEGVSNRRTADLLIQKLESRNVRCIKIYDEVLDTPLAERTRRANEIHKQEPKSILLDLHSNAFNSKARGFSVFTSIGQTSSDLWAEKLIDLYAKNVLPKFNSPVRVDMSDGDKDWEARFWMLVQTNCYAILPEALFFDNLEDALILNNSNFLEVYTDVLAESVVWAFENLKF